MQNIGYRTAELIGSCISVGLTVMISRHRQTNKHTNTHTDHAACRIHPKQKATISDAE